MLALCCGLSSQVADSHGTFLRDFCVVILWFRMIEMSFVSNWLNRTSCRFTWYVLEGFSCRNFIVQNDYDE